VRRLRPCPPLPARVLPPLLSENVTRETASGRATLSTWSVVHRNDLPPFAARTPCTAAVVDLAEGPRTMTELVDAEAAGGPHPGTEPEVTFRADLPLFRSVRRV